MDPSGISEMRKIDWHVNMLPDWARSAPNEAALHDETDTIRRQAWTPSDLATINPRTSPQVILAEMDAHRIDSSLVFSYQWLSADRCRNCNNYVVEQVRTYKGRFFGLVVVQPRDPRSLDDLEKFLNEPGIIGVKMKPKWGGFSLADVKLIGPIAEMLISRNRILLTHVSQSFHRSEGDSVCDLFALVTAFPKLMIVAAHLGGFIGVYECYEPVARRLENLYVDISLPKNLTWLPQLMRYGKPWRYLYATDFPYMEFGEMDRALTQIGLTDEEHEMVTRRNGAMLLERIGIAS